MGIAKWVLAFVSVWSYTCSPCHAEWAITYGGCHPDEAYAVQQTADGGYVVTGYTASFGASFTNIWVLKLNSDLGIAWQRSFGGGGIDGAYAVEETADRGYVVAGKTSSFGAGSSDIWVLKFHSDGSTAWQKTYGGSDAEVAYAIQQTSDEGYILAGETESPILHNKDIWVLKLNPDGDVSWQKKYGGPWDDVAYAVQQTLDGGYILAAHTHPSADQSGDFWVLKLHVDGTIAWQKTYGGDHDDRALSIVATTDGGYAVAGATESFGAGSSDIWVLKLHVDGTIAWQKTYGGDSYEAAYAMQRTSDGGYVAAGWTSSFGVGYGDIWVLKLNADGSVAWQNTYGDTDMDVASTIQQTFDGGYILACRSYVPGEEGRDFVILRLDANGHTRDGSGMGTSEASVSDTSVTGQSVYIVPENTFVHPSNTAALPQDTWAGPSLDCGDPVIDSLKPRPFEPGRVMRIVGHGFNVLQGDSVVHIGNRIFDSSSPRIKLWSPTKIKIKIPKYKCQWFEDQDDRSRKVWVTVRGIDSNKKKMRVIKPAACQ
jgi:uncharacterized delta-60 repeat protein